MSVEQNQWEPAHFPKNGEKTYLIHIFKAGLQKDNCGVYHEFSVGELKEIASAFNQIKLRVPIVIGHPKTDAPKYGEVKELIVEGIDLYAKATLDSYLIDKIKSGAYPNRSAAFWDINSEHNINRGKSKYLRHIGFLDKNTPPSVKGLKPINLSESSDVLAFSEFNGTSHQYSQYIHDQVLCFQEDTGLDYQSALAQILKAVKSKPSLQQAVNQSNDSSSEQLHQKILAYKDQTGCTYHEAFNHIINGR